MQKINFNDRYGLTQAVIEGRSRINERQCHIIRAAPQGDNGKQV